MSELSSMYSNSSNISHSHDHTHLSKGSVEYIHGAVVGAVLHVLHIVLHLHLDRVTIIVLTTLKLLVSVLPCKTLWI